MKMFKSKGIPLHKLFPSIITILALCVGTSSIKFALEGKLEFATMLLLLSCILDVLDGRVARMLHATSDFGAHLDSLADMVNFGAVPAIVLYLQIMDWANYPIHNLISNTENKFLWLSLLVYISCGALRLARFNVQSFGKKDQKQKPKYEQDDYDIAYMNLISSGHFSNGVPITVAAILVLVPVMASFKLCDYNSIILSTWFIIIYCIIISSLMVCPVPTFTTKRIRIAKKYIPFVLVGFIIMIAFLLLYPWIYMPIISLIYLGSIPFSIWRCRTLINQTVDQQKIEGF